MNNPNTFNRARILRATLTLARRKGIYRVVKKDIAEHLGCGTGTVNHHWGTMDALRAEVVGVSAARRDVTLMTGKTRRK